MRTSNTDGKILLNDIITSAMADYDIEIMRKIKMINIMSITVFIQEKNAMRIIFFFLCAALLFSLSLLPRLAADETPLIFIGDQSYAPVESLKDGRPEGLNIELLQALSKAMGRKISIQLILWNEAQEKVLKGEADALTIMSPSDERRTLYDFSDPTLPVQYSFFVKSDNMTIHQVKDLEGKRVGVTMGGFPRKVLESNNRIQLVFIEDYREGYQLLRSGTIDAVGADTWVGAYTIQEHGIRGVKVAGEPFAKKSSCIAVKKGNVKLLHDINAGIKKLRNDGTIEHLIDKWSSREVVFLTRERIRTILLVAIIMLFLAVAGAIIIWNKALREQVREKIDLLCNSEENYRSLVESTDDAIYLLDRNGRYMFNNEQSLSRMGATKDKALGRTYREFHAEEESKLFMEKVEEVFEIGESLSYEYRSERKGRYFLRTLSPVKEPGGSIRAVTVVSKDITDRKRAEEVLRESNETLSAILEAAPLPIFTLDLEGKVDLIWNPAAERILGWKKEEVLGMLYPTIPPGREEEFSRNLERALSGEGLRGNEARRQRRDRSPIDYRIYTAPLHDIQGSVKGIVAILLDITARKQAEEELRMNEERYRNLFNEAPVGIHDLDRHGRITRVNRTELKMLGYTEKEILGKYVWDLIVERDVSHKAFASKMTGAKPPGKAFERTYRRKDGTTFPIIIEDKEIENESGQIIGLQSTMQDITARKKAEEQLNQSLREKEVLLQEIHHRVKNNMQVISSLLKLQAESIEDEALRTAFRESQNRVRAMSLVHEKLYQAKDLAHVPFKDYLQSLMRYLYQSYTPRARNLELSSEIEALSLDITHAIPCGLILNELLSNAFTHAFPGEREGTVTVSLRSPEPHTYELTVSDDGVGIPEEIDPHTTQSLGLHLVTILVEDQLKGKVELERGKGTTFRVTFKVQ